MERLTYRGSERMTEDGLVRPSYSDYPTRRIIERLAEYEDTDLTPEEFKESVDFTLELNKKIKKVLTDLKYYLDTNEENGVVYIPKFVIEKMVNEHLKIKV